MRDLPSHYLEIARVRALQLGVTPQDAATALLAERRVDIGDRVEAGHVLLRIEAPEIDQELMRSRAAVRQIEARLALPTWEFERTEVLAPKGHVSVQIRDERFAAKLTAEADLAAARAEVKRLEEIQSFQTVRAPFAEARVLPSTDTLG